MKVGKIWKVGGSLVVAIPRHMLAQIGGFKGSRVLVGCTGKTIWIENFEEAAAKEKWLALDKRTRRKTEKMKKVRNVPKLTDQGSRKT